MSCSRSLTLALMRSHNFSQVEPAVVAGLATFETRNDFMTVVSKESIDTVSFIASRIELKESARTVLVNMLILRSRSMNNFLDAALPENEEAAMKGADNVLNYKKNALVDFTQVVRFSIKVVLHKLYQFFSVDRPLKEAVIRSWSHTTLKYYSKEVKSSTILVYPFTGNPLRGIVYLIQLRRNKYDARLAYLPYHFSDVLKLWLNVRKRDVLLAEFEFDAFYRHAKELLGKGIAKIYSTDEFEMASHILHGELMNSGVVSINKCHGLSLYGPYVAATKFYVLNESQKRYYSLRGKVLEFIVDIPRPCDKPLVARNEAFVVVYMAGNWSKGKAKSQYKLQAGILQSLRSLADDKEMEVFVRPHPDWGVLKKLSILRMKQVALLNNMEDVAGKTIVFVNIASGSFFDYRNWGVTLFIEGENINPSELFGDKYNLCPVEALHERILRLKDSYEYKSAHEAQLRSVQSQAI